MHNRRRGHLGGTDTTGPAHPLPDIFSGVPLTLQRPGDGYHSPCHGEPQALAHSCYCKTFVTPPGHDPGRHQVWSRPQGGRPRFGLQVLYLACTNGFRLAHPVDRPQAMHQFFHRMVQVPVSLCACISYLGCLRAKNSARLCLQFERGQPTGRSRL